MREREREREKGEMSEMKIASEEEENKRDTINNRKISQGQLLSTALHCTNKSTCNYMTARRCQVSSLRIHTHTTHMTTLSNIPIYVYVK
jgi:hypothetical protein